MLLVVEAKRMCFRGGLISQETFITLSGSREKERRCVQDRFIIFFLGNDRFHELFFSPLYHKSLLHNFVQDYEHGALGIV